jgi:hypothetical protein
MTTTQSAPKRQTIIPKSTNFNIFKTNENSIVLRYWWKEFTEKPGEPGEMCLYRAIVQRRLLPSSVEEQTSHTKEETNISRPTDDSTERSDYCTFVQVAKEIDPDTNRGKKWRRVGKILGYEDEKTPDYVKKYIDYIIKTIQSKTPKKPVVVKPDE